MNLVIVESPSKAKTVSKYLGKEYLVKASKGHIIDLPKSKLGIAVDKNFEPEYEIKNKESLKEIKEAFKKTKRLILAVDLDREGEAIAWSIAKELNTINEDGKITGEKPVERIVFSEISKNALEEAMKFPRGIDINLVSAQKARRVLDRLVGYKLSPLLWKKISFGLSAGRVQSVALRLIVEREEEREKFNKEEYWTVESYISSQRNIKPKALFFETEKEKLINKENKALFRLSKMNGSTPKMLSKKDCEIIAKEILFEKWIISKIEQKNINKYPKPPLITSTLQQLSNNKFGFSSKKTMQIAQKLYESGYITYMRTDSVFMSGKAREQGVILIKKNFGQEYLPQKPVYYKNKKGSQEAHECIRPVDFFKKAENLNLKEEESKIYNIIWQRALASLMSPAVILNTIAEVDIKSYKFRSTVNKVIFQGFLKITGEKILEEFQENFFEGQEVFLNELVSVQHFTEPPPRYSEATLVKTLEELGVGRPSTYASIIGTIIARKYVVIESRYLVPTDMGRVVNSLLVKHFPNIVDYKFTAKMEDDLDKVALGSQNWVELMKNFYFPFEKDIEKKEKSISRSDYTVLGKSEEKCSECGKKMVVKLGRFGKFLSCSSFPKCKGMKPLDQNTGKQRIEIDLDEYENAPKTLDNRDFLLKKGRFGYFWAHPDYPKIKEIKSLEYKKEILIEKFGDPPKTKDNREFVLKKGRFGYFWAHPDYPEIKEIVKIAKKKEK